MNARTWAGVLVALLVAACDSVAPTPSVPPTTPNSSASANQSSGAPDSGLSSPEPGASFEPLAPAPLPQPTLADGGSIGQALYDPAMVPDGVVSLLHEVGVEIVDAEGSVLRPGHGRLSMTEDAVRGAIDMTYDELEMAGDEGAGPVRVADLYAGLSGSLPAGFTVDEFATAYNDAYFSEPESLVAGVMLGMPITPETRLLSIQAWLLIVDGFVLRDDAVVAGSRSLARGGGLSTRPVDGLWSTGAAQTGAAASRLPALRSPISGIDDQDWADLLAGLRYLAFRVPFRVQGLAAVHEGHGRPGPRLQATARIGRPADVVSARTGTVLLRGRNGSDGTPITWRSDDESVLREHGQIIGQLNSPMNTDASGAVRIAYQVRQEVARRRIVTAHADPTLTARAEQRHLILEGFELPPEVYDAMTAGGLVSGTRDADGGQFRVEWHEEDVLYVCIENKYNYTFTVGLIAELHRDGTDSACGGLWYNADDKTYRGVLDASSEGHAAGMAVLTLGGLAECSGDDSSGTQELYVIGEKRGNDFLLLRFYPFSPPNGNFTLCQATIPYRGGGRYQRQGGSYLPLNDTRWSSPDVGYEVQVPSAYGVVDYIDDAATDRSKDICSEFWVRVIRPDPDEPAAPSFPPGPPAWTC